LTYAYYSSTIKAGWLKMTSMRHFWAAAAGLALCAFAAHAQHAISAKSGLVNYTEGRVLIDGAPVVAKVTDFPEVKESQTLKTEEGRAEMILTPGVFLRVAEDSAIKMLSNRLIDTRVEVLEGSAIVECAELSKDNSVTIHFRDAQMSFKKRGVFRIDANENVIRVYDGEAVVTMNGQSLTLKEGRQTPVAAVLAPERFNNKTGDPFFRWTARRSEAIAIANISAARSFGGSSSYGFWHFNPYFGMFTYIPGTGIYRSFFGHSFYSPRQVWIATTPRVNSGIGGGPSRMDMPSYNPSYGYSTVGTRGSPGYANTTAPSAPASAPAASPRSADGAAPRDGGGGRGR
jgi:hypothetical protein